MKASCDIIVVGAGPAGSMAARFAAEQGVSVLMLEKDRDVGYPVRCGEAVSKAGVEEFIPSNDQWIAAKISKFSFNAPDGTEVILDFGEAGYVLERRIFDYELARTAADAGADILTRAYVNGLLFDNGKVIGVVQFLWLTQDGYLQDDRVEFGRGQWGEPVVVKSRVQPILSH